VAAPPNTTQPARQAARLARATKCVTLRAADIACRYNDYILVELLEIRFKSNTWIEGLHTAAS